MNFGLDELKAAREVLHRNTGTKSYTYKGPHDPATSHQKASYCVASIIQKIEELDRNNPQFLTKYVCSAVDLHRLMNLNNINSDNVKLDLRLTQVENELKSLKSVSQSVHTTSWPKVGSTNSNSRSSLPPPPYSASNSNRQKLLSSVNGERTVDSPNKRRRTGEPVQQYTRSNVKEFGNPQLKDWIDVQHKKNGQRPGASSTLKGRPPKSHNTGRVLCT